MSTVKTEVQDINETRKKITVEIAGTEISDMQKQLVKEFQREARIPGFRPGKASENMVRMRYAKELKSELSKRVAGKAYQEGIAKADLQVYTITESDEGDIEPGVDASMSFTVDIVPEFELPDFSTFKLRVESSEPSEKEVNDVIQQILSQRAEFKAVEKVVEKGDYVKCSYEGKIGEELIADLVPDASMWGTQKMTWEEAGVESSFGVSAVVEGLVGMQAGDEKEVSMDFAEDFKQEALAGKSAVYSLKVEEVRQKILPEIDEAFLETMQMKDEAELRNRISENLENQKKMQSAGAERDQITRQLLESIDFALPESGLEGERTTALVELMQRKMQKDAKHDDLDALREELSEEAARVGSERLKSRLILSKIAEKEGVQVSQEDLGQVIINESQSTGKKPEKIVKELQKDQNRLNLLRGEIMRQKALDLVVKKAEREIIAKNIDTAETVEV